MAKPPAPFESSVVRQATWLFLGKLIIRFINGVAEMVGTSDPDMEGRPAGCFFTLIYSGQAGRAASIGPRNLSEQISTAAWRLFRHRKYEFAMNACPHDRYLDGRICGNSRTGGSGELLPVSQDHEEIPKASG